MRLLFSLTYYRPHVSGLTIYVERLAEALVRRGHEVTILTSRHDVHLPVQEYRNGVRVERVPVALRLSKGPIMPAFPLHARRLVESHDLVSLHLPQVEAAAVAAPARLADKPVLLTYHCDLILPPGRLNRAIDETVFTANVAAGAMADGIVAYTEDYADHSRFLRRFRKKVTVIPPPVVMPAPTPETIDAFRASQRLHGPVIGYASRFASEKGIHLTVEAMPELLRRFPDLTVLFAGPAREVIGEEAYWRRLMPEIAQFGDHWRFLGTLSAGELPAFYGALDALLMTSVNATESFGLVQVEAMLCGTPVVTSDLPGVRQPVTKTGMGIVTPINDVPALVEGITQVLSSPDRFVRPRADIETQFDLERTLEGYEKLFATALSHRKTTA